MSEQRDIEEVYEILVDYANAQEAAAVNMKQQIYKRVKTAQAKYDEKDFNGLKWETKEGTKGEYQQTTKEANQNNEIFQALQQILKDHSGFWQSSAHKYWNHRDDKDTIDRRKK